MKSGSSITARVTALLLVVILLVGGALAWWFDATRPADSADASVIPFAIQSGEGVRSIASNLSDRNLIRSPTAFFVLVKLMGIETSLQAGQFTLSRSMDMRTIARALMHGYDDVTVQVKEGLRNKEIVDILKESKFRFDEDEFLEAAREGYMFPETYQIPRDATPGAIIDIFTREFNKQVTEQMRADIRARGMTLEDVIILASIVEREAGKTDRPTVAGVLLNRLDAGMPLQADATVQYALRYDNVQRTYWKKSLTADDLKIESPYNTYLHNGLPPAPISNPGIDAIKAVIYPQKTDYMYYIHDPQGGVHFARTLDEHNANVARYLR